MSLKRSYTVIAPLYDRVIAGATRNARRISLAPLAEVPPGEVLVAGVGTGLDLPHLPSIHTYVGLDLTEAMLRRSLRRAGTHRYHAVLGSALALPFADDRFDHTVLHLILAVVPDPATALSEALRVTRPGGTLFVFDKFLRPGQRAWLRRALTPLSMRIATRMDVVLEEVLAQVPAAVLERDEPALARGWFRRVRLRRV
ncbi:methyltransferase domain-containing protein [Nitrogeniibacter mangrovi]|uniref:Methyltransferase domain-containing protein n=1 Tax=Nitrogeniibacter mangrovi TaxID=2016596 RepID=A0A6C1B2J6_9RHOO|nr:class I SAM-dependent methyltransferase [Nitrogeniibacter mangrovi]QID17048.1 methyltransferase domain-containing protein [Nitrogeniibacter mangrovi]